MINIKDQVNSNEVITELFWYLPIFVFDYGFRYAEYWMSDSSICGEVRDHVSMPWAYFRPTIISGNMQYTLSC